MKKLSEAGKLTEAEIEGILGEVKKKETDRVIFKNEQLYRFFPSTYTSEAVQGDSGHAQACKFRLIGVRISFEPV